MKSIKAIFVIALIISSNLVFGQEPSFYELTFGIDSTTTPYKANNDNFVFIRSKRGTEPVKATSAGDSIKSFVIQKIVLVFSESSTSELENRDAYNQERWENLIPTYPEFFQATTTYKNICQCSQDAAGQDYKAVQGFYIYYTPKAGSEPKKEVEVAKVETPKAAEPEKQEPKKEVVVAKVETPIPAEPKKETVKEEPKKDVESIKKVEPKKVKEVEAKVEVAKVEEVKPVEVVKKEEPKKEVEAITPPTNTNTEEVTDSKNKATAPPAKPRKAKDPKACRTACYGTGESDLNAFFKDKVVLTKKMKKDEVDLKLQLNVDGTVKKVVIKGENAELNKLVEEAVKDMIWNASVKSGLTIKSEVKMILKFDKKLKGLKAEELMVSPRLGPKCLTCTSDDELFIK
jgi:hypothetical protein